MCGCRTSLFYKMLIRYEDIPKPVEIKDEECVDDLQLAGLRLIQKKNGFKLGMDSVLLADFAPIGPGDRVADFGTGTGALPLLLRGRGKGEHYYAFEIQQELAETAARTMMLNGLENQVQIYAEDAGNAAEILPGNSLDAIICNPPYGEPGKALHNPSEERAVSRHQKEDTLFRYLKTAYRLLRGKGRMILVYPAYGMLKIMRMMQEAHVEPKRFRMVYPYADKPANLVLIEGIKDARAMLHPMPPMIIYNKDGDLTNELKSVYHIAERPDFSD